MTQLTRTQFAAFVTQYLPTNHVGQISAAVMRQTFTNALDSVQLWYDEKVKQENLDPTVFGDTAGSIAEGNDPRFLSFLEKDENLADLNDVPTARNNLGLGDSATRDVGTTAGTVAAGDDPRFANIAQHMLESRAFAITQNIPASIEFLWLGGFYALGDSPASVYKKLAVPPVPVKLWHFQSADGAYWEFVVQDEINLRQLGAKGDLSADDSPSIQACIDLAAGRWIHADVGQYRMDSVVTSTIPVNLYGDGNGAGPGSAAQSNDNCTQFYLNYANPSAFSVTSLYPSIFKNFQINVDPGFRTPGRGGTGISILAIPSGTIANCLIEGVSFNWVARGLYFYKPSWNMVRQCYFDDWVTDGIFAETELGTEGAFGYIENNYFFGEPSTSQGSCIHVQCGYGVISRNEILGAQVGIRVVIDKFNAGYVRILDNTIEEQGLFGVNIAASVGAYTLALLEISRNEFAELFTNSTYQCAVIIADKNQANWLTNVNISDNMSYNGAASCNHYWIQSGNNVSFNNNKAQNISGNPHVAFNITPSSFTAGLVAPVVIANNSVVAGFTGSVYNLPPSGIVQVIDPIPRLVAELPANAANGSQMFCSDAHATNWAALNMTAVTGGNGSIVQRATGAWLAVMP